MMNSRETMEHKDKFWSYIDAYGHRDFLREDFYEATMDLAHFKMPKISFSPISMIEYKKGIIDMFKRKIEEETREEFNFSDQELLENRIINNDKLRNMKITKLLTKKIKETSQYAPTQFLDYFHKLPIEDDEYFISSDPVDILQAYNKIDTCVSPGGDNIANIFQFLVSPIIYIAFNKALNSRALIYLDEKEKVFSLGAFYGKYNLMIEFSLIKWFIEKGYKLSENISDHFNANDFYYYDSSTGETVEKFLFFNGELASKKENNYEKVEAFKAPEGFRFSKDLIKGFKVFSEKPEYTTSFVLKSKNGMLLEEYEEICNDCGDIVDSDDYDFDYEMCSWCWAQQPHNYCDSCGGDFFDEDFEHEEDVCFNCHLENLAEQKADEEFDLMREEKLINL